MEINQTEISRVTRSKAEAQTTYDRISGWYDLREGVWEKKSKDLLCNISCQSGSTQLDEEPL